MLAKPLAVHALIPVMQLRESFGVAGGDIFGAQLMAINGFLSSAVTLLFGFCFQVFHV